MAESVSWTSTIFKWLAHARYNLTPSTAADNGVHELQCDSKGALHVRIQAEGPESGTSGASSWSPPATNAYEYRRAVKASAGILRHIEGFNNGASTRYFQVFDSPTEPSANTVPKLCFSVAANTNFSWDLARGRSFTTGIYVGVSTDGTGYVVDAAATFFFVAEYV